MTIKELKAILNLFDENAEVEIVDNHWCEPISIVDEDDDGKVIIMA